MEQYIKKSDIVAEIERRLEKIANASSENNRELSAIYGAQQFELINLALFINNLEVKEVVLIIHTIIAECCDWLAMNTNLSHDKIEGCRNLMLTVKEEQFKAQEPTEDKHWQDVRERAAIAAMQGVMKFFGSIDYDKEEIAKLAVEQADALIEQLKVTNK